MNKTQDLVKLHTAIRRKDTEIDQRFKIEDGHI